MLSLEQNLTKEELVQVRATSSIQQLHQVAINAQLLSCKGARTGRVQNLVRVLDHYSGVHDTLSQSHAEYCCLVWGPIKWLLQISIDY
jgi:hypothetical protein